MDLWIRSQDKKILEKVNKLYVTTFSENKGFGIYDLVSDDIDDCDIPLGFYESEERALEVLDDIFEVLGEVDVIDKESRKEVALGANKHYIMPEE